MNLFFPYPDIDRSVRALDDLRLNKQILECYQMVKVATGNSSGYATHPVIKHYCRYPLFVARYGRECCYEYSVRSGKNHRLASYFDMMVRILPDVTPIVYLYAEYPVTDPRCIRETNTESVLRLFQEKLIRKWLADIEKGRPPRWTKRGAPEFWRNDRS